MMTFLPKDELKPDDDGKKGPSTNRIIMWVLVGGVGLYLLGSGLFGVFTK